MRFKPFWHKRRLLQILASAVAGVMLATSFPQAPQAWAAIQVAVPTGISNTIFDLTALNLDSLNIPEQLGRKIDTWQPDGIVPEGLVIHIQDMHVHPEAQRNIAQILSYLHDQYGVTLVGLEGAEGACDTTLYSDLPDPPSTEQVAQLFVNEGIFTGAEYYGITRPGTVTLWGVENKEAYFEHLKAYREGATANVRAQAVLVHLEQILAEWKERLYPLALQHQGNRILTFYVPSR